MENKYADGTVAQQGDVVYCCKGRYVVVNPTYSDGFVCITGIENSTGFTRKAPIETCKRYVPDQDEKQHAAKALEKGQGWLKEHPPLN
jgi:hypothetical protein